MPPVELVDVQWSSYVWVPHAIVSEFLVRYFGPSAYAEKHGEGRVVDDTQTVYFSFSFGISRQSFFIVLAVVR